MDRHDCVVVLRRHLDQRPVAHDAGIVHEDVDGPERLDRLGDDASGSVEVGHGIAVGNGLPTCVLDEPARLGRRSLCGAGAVESGPEVVDHDAGALGGQTQRNLAADAAARAGDHRHSVVQ